MPDGEALAASFRDPSGFMFRRDGVLYRQVNIQYREEYDCIMGSGLYDALVRDGRMVAHHEVELAKGTSDAYRVIRPEVIPFISYPYEWSFSQLKDAALLTLAVQKRAFEFGMTLKDASAYNVQFRGSRPVFIDTLSFQRYHEGQLWSPYRQFCQQFLAPLALMSRVDVRLGQLSRIHIDGVPLDLAGKLLPLSSRLDFSLLTHLHLHAREQKRYADKQVNPARYKMGRLRFQALIDGLEGAVRKLEWRRPKGVDWSSYYDDNSYTSAAFAHKNRLVDEVLGGLAPAPRQLWDLGANTGHFSRIAAARGIETIAFDVDHACVEESYLSCRRDKIGRMLPLLSDLTNPSSGIGWAGRERSSLSKRGPADAVLGLALIHHLAIANNVPLAKVADYFGNLCRWLIIEFVPKEDSQVQRLLSTREDIFPHYTPQGFLEAFKPIFTVRRSEPIEGSSRILYLMERL